MKISYLTLIIVRRSVRTNFSSLSGARFCSPQLILLSLLISSEAVRMYPDVLARNPADVETSIFSRARSEVIDIYMN